MGKFLKTISAFILSPILLYVLGFLVLKFFLQKEISNYSYVILGDSQTEYILHPDIYNRSIKGSPYFIHYEFAKEFADQLAGKTIYIACNYQNFSKLYQNRLENENLFPGWRSSMVKELDRYHILNYPHKDILPPNTNYPAFDIKKIPKLIREIYFKKDPVNVTKNIRDTLTIGKTIKRHWKHNGYISDDQIQRYYLMELVNLLKKNNCEVVLLKMPLTRYYSRNVPLEIHQELIQFSNDNHIRLLDLDNHLFPSSEYNYFKDYGHLNTKGDSVVMKYLLTNELK